MSDAITLDVLSSSPVQLDAGDADPIAREEITELAERVEAIEADYVTSEDVMGALGGEAPALVSGSSRAVLGDPETASWMERITAADGAALIESVQGNTVVQDGSLLPVRMEGVETVAADESWSSQRTIPAETYFPQGLRSAGSVRDELRADAAITRVGERAYQSGDESDASVITDGTVTHYVLATPTTTPIDPPLLLSYRVGAGGTERVMVASGTTSAPPVFATRYPLDPADLAASIAPRESAVAEANHAVGDLIMLGWTLCKVTTAIARGEAITIGTNVTQTSVAAEIAALS